MLCSFESNVHLFQSVFSLKIRVCIQFKGSLQSMEYSNPVSDYHILPIQLFSGTAHPTHPTFPLGTGTAHLPPSLGWHSCPREEVGAESSFAPQTCKEASLLCLAEGGGRRGWLVVPSPDWITTEKRWGADSPFPSQIDDALLPVWGANGLTK